MTNLSAKRTFFLGTLWLFTLFVSGWSAPIPQEQTSNIAHADSPSRHSGKQSLPAASDTGTTASQNPQIAQLHLVLQERYADGSLAEMIRRITPDDGLAFLTEVLDLIDEQFYQPVDLLTSWQVAYAQLEMALDDHPLLDTAMPDTAALQRLQQAIQDQRRRLNDRSILSRRDLFEWVRELAAVSSQTPLGGAWPAVELAFIYTDNLDSYSYMLTPAQYRDMQDKLHGSYTGMGVELIETDTHPVIYDVLQHSPAARAGVQAGDVLLAINDLNLNGQSLYQVTRLLSSSGENNIDLSLQRQDRLLNVAVRPEIVTAPSVRRPMLLNNVDGIGYVQLAGFDDDTALELRRALDVLRDRGMRRLIIDLRNNGGGMLRSAVEVTSLFLESGLVATVVYADHQKQLRVEYASESFTDLPLVLLVNAQTASAAEILTAALQDYHRAVVIGEKTRGKGVIQTVYPLRTQPGGLCITTASYLPPSQISFHHIGINPDQTISSDDAGAGATSSLILHASENPVLQHAVTFLKTGTWAKK